MKNSDIAGIRNKGFNSRCFDVRWRVTNLCNYDCSFCIQGRRDEKIRNSRMESEETRKRILDELCEYLDAIEGYDSLRISLIGGEVTVLKDFPEILERLCGISFGGTVSFHITTNFSAPFERYRDIIDIARKHDGVNGRRMISLTASFYRDYVKEEEFFEKIRSLNEYMTGSSAFGTARQIAESIMKHFKMSEGPSQRISVGYPMLSDSDFESFMKRRKSLASLGVPVSPIIIRNHETDLSEEVTEKLLKEESRLKNIEVLDRRGRKHCFRNIQAVGESLSDADSFCPKGYMCDAGINNIWISSEGEVFRCPAIGSDMTLGSLLDDTFIKNEEMAVCTSDHCSCNQFGLIRR